MIVHSVRGSTYCRNGFAYQRIWIRGYVGRLLLEQKGRYLHSSISSIVADTTCKRRTTIITKIWLCRLNSTVRDCNEPRRTEHSLPASRPMQEKRVFMQQPASNQTGTFTNRGVMTNNR